MGLDIWGIQTEREGQGLASIRERGELMTMKDVEWSDDDGQTWVVTISDRKVSRSLRGKRTKCWNGCKDEKTGDFIMLLPIIMNDENHDYCSRCCTAWVISGLVEGEI